MKETHFLSKIYFQKMQWSNSETVNARAFKPLSLCSAPLKNLVVGITRDFWSSRNERNPLSKQNMITSENACGLSQKIVSLQNFARASAPHKFWSSRKKRNFKNVF